MPHSSKRLLPLLLVLGVILVAVWVRLRSSPRSVPTDSLLRLSDTLSAPTPPDSPKNDLPHLQEHLATLREIWTNEVGEGEAESLWREGEVTYRAGDIYSARVILENLRSRKLSSMLSPQQAVQMEQRLGQANLELGRYASALQVYQTLLNRQPNNISAMIGLNRAYRGLNRNAEAIKVLQSAASALVSQEPKPGLLLASELQQYLQNEQALQLLETLHHNTPDDHDVTLKLAFAYYNQQQFDKAEALYTALLATQKEDAKMYRDYAILLANPLYIKRDLAKAEHYFLKALQRESGDVGIMERLGSLMMEQERYRHAIYVYSNLLTGVPDSAGARLALANAYARSGDTENARRQQEIAKPLAERDQQEERLKTMVSRQLANEEAQLNLVHHYLQNGQYTRAYQQLQIALAHCRDKGNVVRELKSLLDKMGLPLPKTYQVNLP